jgi:transposase-like protein
VDTKRLEVAQLIERRRKWPAEVKARIMEEALAPGTTIASVAGSQSTLACCAWHRAAR